MNDLAVRNDDLPALFDLAKQLVPTGMLPVHLKTPGQVVAVILAGRELGMPPMRALRSLTLVKGKVVESADSQLGRFKAAGGKATFEKHDDTEAVLRLTHPNGDEHVERFTMTDAKRAGLTSNNTWTSYPRAMLRSRVITAGLKSIGWDGGAGVYEPDEAREMGAPPSSEPVVQMPRRLSERKPEPVEQRTTIDLSDIPEPSLEECEADARLHEEIVEKLQNSLDAISPQQVKKLWATLRASPHSEDDFKTWLRESMGLDSSKAIPAAKFDQVIRRIEDAAPLWHDYEEETQELPLAGRPRFVRSSRR